MPEIITVGLLLAAGASRRFGPENKLLATLSGRPLIAHATDAMRGAGLVRRVAVISDRALRDFLDGFEVVLVPQGRQSDSLRAGLNAVGQVDRLLIALGDMPNVTSDLLDRVISRCSEYGPSASCDTGGPPMPPACFPAALLPELTLLTGDQGAGRLIRDLPGNALVFAPGLLRDIDHPADLAVDQPPG